MHSSVSALRYKIESSLELLLRWDLAKVFNSMPGWYSESSIPGGIVPSYGRKIALEEARRQHKFVEEMQRVDGGKGYLRTHAGHSRSHPVFYRSNLYFEAKTSRLNFRRAE